VSADLGSIPGSRRREQDRSVARSEGLAAAGLSCDLPGAGAPGRPRLEQVCLDRLYGRATPAGQVPVERRRRYPDSVRYFCHRERFIAEYCFGCSKVFPRKLLFSALAFAAPPRCLKPCSGSLSSKIALEFSQRPRDVEEQPAGGARGVNLLLDTESEAVSRSERPLDQRPILP
jgi:hypothetical protein